MSDTDISIFPLQVEGLGQFLFRRRRMRLDIACNVERARLTEGVRLDPFTYNFVNAIAELKVLLVEAPDGSGMQPDELDELDTFDDEAYAKVIKVWSALDDKEQTFRKGTSASKQEGRA